MVIFLVGFMGCGKSTVGRKVAKRLHCRFADMDVMVEEKAGMSINEIFNRYGESYFREMETEVLKSFDKEENIIVATGGGVPCSDANIALMKNTGRMVYFDTSPEKLFDRLKAGRNKRPKLSGMDDGKLRAFINETLEDRQKYYRQAHVIIDCNGVSDEYIANHISYYISQTAV